MGDKPLQSLPPSGFGEALQRVRLNKGLTQKEVAEKAGIHPNTVARLERGKMEPSWQLVLAIAKALRVTCEVFSNTERGSTKLTVKPQPVNVDRKPAIRKSMK
jgi:transcriptional regulator with XRE-family HTH domain